MTIYRVAPSGNDANDGLTFGTAWKTSQKVSETIFVPLDRIWFYTGEYNGSFRPIGHYGSAGDPVIYEAAPGNTPVFTCYFDKGQEGDWEYMGDNLWRTYTFDITRTTNPELLTNPEFETGSTPWFLQHAAGVTVASSAVPNPDFGGNMYGVQVTTSTGLVNDIVLSQRGIPLEAYTVYELRFLAKVDSGTVLIPGVRISQKVSPFSQVDVEQSTKPEFLVTTSWQWFSRFIVTTKYQYGTLNVLDLSDNQLDIAIGVIPSGTIMFFDKFSLKKVGTTFPSYDTNSRDVGHIVQGSSIRPWKYLTNGEIIKVNGFSSNWETWETWMMSSENPGKRSTLLTMRYHGIMLRVDKIALDGLEVTKVAGNGIHATNCNDLLVQNCHVHHVGGSYLYNTGTRAGERQGDGIQIWENCQRFRGTNNTVHDVYDCGITNQAYGAADGGPSFVQNDIVFEDNILFNCEHTIIILGLDPASSMSNVYYRRNISIGAGFSWARQVRKDNYKGFHIIMYNMYCAQSNINIVDNVFAFWTDGYRLQQLPIDAAQYTMDRNYIIGRPNDYAYVEVVGSGDSAVITPHHRFRDFADYVSAIGFESASTPVRMNMPINWGTGKIFLSKQSTGGYGEEKIVTPWGSTIYALFSAVTSPEHG